jgi:protein TonB
VSRTHLFVSALLHGVLLAAFAGGGAASRAKARRLIAEVLPDSAAVEAAPAAPAPVLEAAIEPSIDVERPLLAEAPDVVQPFAEPAPPPATAAIESARDWREPEPQAWAAIVRRRPEPPAAEPATAAREESAAAAAVIAAVPGTNAPPEYPALARRRGWQGTVVLLVRADAAGAVVEVRVLRSSGRAVLDDAAARAVRAWRFDGGPGTAEVPIEFRLG